MPLKRCGSGPHRRGRGRLTGTGCVGHRPNCDTSHLLLCGLGNPGAVAWTVPCCQVILRPSRIKTSRRITMRKVKVIEYVTLDGVMEDPGPSGDFKHRGWTMPYWNDELANSQSDQLFASDALLLGRETYAEFVAAWPLRSGDPFTDRMNSLPKFVASTSLQEPLAWNATLLHGDVAEAVANLKQQPGEDILIYGSGALVNTLMARNLIDEYRFMLYPLVLGTGKRLFRDGNDKTTLTLKRAETASSGVVMLVCEPAA